MTCLPKSNLSYSCSAMEMATRVLVRDLHWRCGLRSWFEASPSFSLLLLNSSEDSRSIVAVRRFIEAMRRGRDVGRPVSSGLLFSWHLSIDNLDITTYKYLVERSLVPKAKISSTTHVQLLPWLHGKQQQQQRDIYFLFDKLNENKVNWDFFHILTPAPPPPR